MKILFVALGVYEGVGGMERFNQRLVRALGELSQSNGFQCRAIAVWDRPAQASGMPAGVAFHACNRSKIRAALRFFQAVLSQKPEVVLYGHLLLSPLALLARVLSPKSRHALIVHGWEVWREPFRNRIPVWERIAVRLGFDEVVSVSRLTAERMREAYGLPGGIFRLLPNAIDTGAAGGQPVSPPPSDRARRILTVTRLSAGASYKGCDKVIQALPAVLARFPGVEYHIAGDGELRPELERLALRLGVERNVYFHGYVPGPVLEELYRSADVFALPSRGEGFGIVYLEAWKHGLPVIAGDQDAGREVVAHGFNGLCVNPDSVDEISQRLTELLHNPEWARQLGRQGLQTVLDRYTHGHFRANLHRILAGQPAGVQWAWQEG